MKEVKDPEIKLFGKKICLLDSCDMIHAAAAAAAGEEYSGVSGGSSCEFLDGVQESGTENEDEKIDSKSLLEEENKQQEQVLEELQNIEDNHDSATSIDELENDQEDMNDSDQKILKKPDKILPCPRCKSMDTKFCYYNNYNVNQPRHFCKSCQRYWTAGGTMRNVPVGAGRRKNKNFGSNCHYEALHGGGVQMEVTNGCYNMDPKPNVNILSFGGQELPVCDPVSSVLNLNDQNTSLGHQEPVMQQHMNGFLSPVPYFPWPFPWNSAVPMPAFCPPPGYHMPIYPTPLWNCNMNGGGWSFPWLPPPNSLLGKHSRNGEVIRSNDSEGGELREPKSLEGSILVPKTLRIDDPEEAAKSSIWTTLGIKYDSMSDKGRVFKAFEQKTNEKKCLLSTSPALEVNPAALSRSLTFQERA